MVAIIFFTFMFGVLEVTRAIYVLNTLQEVTRRAASAAATTNFKDQTALDKVRQRAVFRTGPGELMLAPPVTDQNVRIDYMSIQQNANGSMSLQAIPEAQMPSCRAENKRICMTNPYDARCIRFVRARICDSADGNGCTPVQFKALFPMPSAFEFALPTAVTIVKAESLGILPGDPGCP